MVTPLGRRIQKDTARLHSEIVVCIEGANWKLLHKINTLLSVSRFGLPV